MPENAILVEGDAALARKIGLDVRTRGDPVVQLVQSGDIALKVLHPFREGVAQSLDDLKQREIDIADPAAGEPAAAVAREQPFEIAEIFRDARLPEFVGALLSGRALVLVIK